MWSGFLDMWGSVPLVAFRSMSPHMALEGQGIRKILATGGTGEKTSLVVPLVVGQAPWLTAIGVRDAISFLLVLVSS